MDLTLVVYAHRVERELPRTIHTLSSAYQREIEGVVYEIVVVDDGFPDLVDEVALRAIAPNTRVIRIPSGNPSPVAAINTAMDSASGRLLGLFVDGVTMVSPGIVRSAIDAHRSDPTRIVGTLGFHLGPDAQDRSVSAGYDRAVEDALLADTPWKENGYALFEIAALAPTSAGGWFGTIAESHAVFLDRDLWQHLGGLDARLASPGDGSTNLDFWKRGVEASRNQPWILLGEGTFRQLGDGAATAAATADRGKGLDEHGSVPGAPRVPPHYEPRFIGKVGRELAERFKGQPSEPIRNAYSVFGRPFKSSIPAQFLSGVQRGTLRTRYCGRRLAKNPFDLVLYLRLLQELKPRTIVEIGTSEGGSALWFRDQCSALGQQCEIISLDIKPLKEAIEGVTFFQADSTRPGETFPHAQLAEAAHPWLVVEDSAHTYESTSAMLEYFHGLMKSGDYIVVEDGIVADLVESEYRKYQDGPNRAVRDFLLRHNGLYGIDDGTCDFYGNNVTYCPNGWIFRR